MNLKVSVYIATSLDGFIARKNGDLDWLDEANSNVPEGEDCGFSKFMASVDALVMGRKTYEKVLSFGIWPYGNTPVIVLSRNKIEFPQDLSQHLSCSSEEPAELCKRLANNGAKRLYIDGGKTIQGFLDKKLITDLTITVIPVLIGQGIPLFGNLKQDMNLEHVATKAFDFGFVQSTYNVKSA